MRTPPREADLSDINREAARAAMATAAKEGRALLTEPEAKAVLAAYGIPTVPTRVAATPQDVEVTAGELLDHAPALAVKVLSEDISHKSDVGGVRLGLQSPPTRGLPPRTLRAAWRRAGPTHGSKASRCSR